MNYPIHLRRKLGLTAGLLLLSAIVASPMPQQNAVPVENAIRHVHDPCLIKQGDTYYLFSTGHGIPIRRSKDLVHWEAAGRVFTADVPEWAKAEIPGTVFPWAPDIAFLNGRYFLYYSISAFGKNRSLIGLATNKTLDPKSPNYAWKDEGKVFESFPKDNYNAIDSNVLALGKNRLVLVFGSFWSGIQLVEADPKTGKPRAGAEAKPLARRPSPDAIEAPFLIRHGDYFYLFVSFDLCCRGTRSTYNIRVGRSKSVEGPYIDRDGKPLLQGGGTVVLQTEGNVIGPGHCAIVHERGRDLLIHHFYDGAANGIPTLQVRPLAWDKDGWVKPLSSLEIKTSDMPEPKSSAEWQARGEAQFKQGKITESLRDFDTFLSLEPNQKPFHWQRGIALYYAGRFAEGKQQFELHQTVNSHDVENAVWHFLCTARAEGLEAAKKQLIPIDQDARVPMAQVHKLFAGKASPEDVLAAAQAAPSTTPAGEPLFYAHLYLGLYFEALGDKEKASEYIFKAAMQAKANGYMGDVARVHAARMKR